MIDMDLCGLRYQDGVRYGKAVLEHRYRDLVYRGPELLENQRRPGHGLLHLGVDHVVEELLRRAYPHATDAPVQGSREVLRRCVAGRRVAAVVAGDSIQDQGGVPYGSGHRACGVQAPAQRVDPASAHAAEGRLEADDAAQGGRYPDGPARVAAQSPHDLSRPPRRNRTHRWSRRSYGQYPTGYGPGRRGGSRWWRPGRTRASGACRR